MARDLKAKIRVTADTKQADTALRGVTKSLAGMATGMLAGAASVGAFARAITFSISAAIEQERAIAALDNQLRELGPSAASVSKELQEQASALQRVTTFGDESIIQAQALIAQFTKEEAAIKDLTAASLNLAAANGIDLATAATLVAKSFGSSTNALARYGIDAEGAAGSTERLESLLESLEIRAGSSAEALADTFGGRLDQLTAALSDTAEEVGEVATESEKLNVALEKTTEAVLNSNESFGNLTPYQKFRKAVANVADVFAPRLADVIRGTDRVVNAFMGTVEGTTEAVEKHAIAVAEAKSAYDALEKTVPDTIAALEKLGVVFDQQVNKEIEKNNKLLEEADVLYNAGLISRDSFERAEAAVAARTRELNGELEIQNEVVSVGVENTQSYAEALRQARAEMDGLTGASERSTEATRANTEANNANRGSQNLLGGESGFAQIGGGTFSIEEGTSFGINGRVSFIGQGGTGAGISAGVGN